MGLSDVLENAEVCTPALDTQCNSVDLAIKRVLDSEQCYTVTRTVCSESTETIDNEVCTYSYQDQTQATTAKTAEVTFEKQCSTQMVTVCQPAQYGYGHHGYGKRDAEAADKDVEKRDAGYGNNLCKEVAQETCYNVPIVTEVNPPVEVVFPTPVKTCVNKPLALPRISCENLSEEKCITVPKVEDDAECREMRNIPGCPSMSTGGAHPAQAGVCGASVWVRRDCTQGRTSPRPCIHTVSATGLKLTATHTIVT